MTRTISAKNGRDSEPAKGMVYVVGGSFRMGSNTFYVEERPCRDVEVASFWIDVYPVTNAAYRRFVKATGYVTMAEQDPQPADYPTADSALLVSGSLVFRQPKQPVDLHNYHKWWNYVPGACWHRPEGPGSTLHGRERHPVVHIAYADSIAYASWAGKAVPTEAEWEYAARGGLVGAEYAWGDEFAPAGRLMANTWQGQFPWQNLRKDGYAGTSPVGSFPPNGYGLFDMIGNVWEWTCDDYEVPAIIPESAACCAVEQTVLHAAAKSTTHSPTLAKVLKGGSHLCAPNYCLRYRPAARTAQTIDSAASHIGFRCVHRTA
jgi:formylglycine-generating enzyme required for sulfatase activity